MAWGFRDWARPTLPIRLPHEFSFSRDILISHEQSVVALGQSRSENLAEVVEAGNAESVSPTEWVKPHSPSHVAWKRLSYALWQKRSNEKRRPTSQGCWRAAFPLVT